MVEFTPSPLNRATTRRYEACRAAGGHVATDDIITRDTGSLDAAPFTICGSCGVPYAKRHISYNGKAITNPMFGVLS